MYSKVHSGTFLNFDLLIDELLNRFDMLIGILLELVESLTSFANVLSNYCKSETIIIKFIALLVFEKMQFSCEMRLSCFVALNVTFIKNIRTSFVSCVWNELMLEILRRDPYLRRRGLHLGLQLKTWWSRWKLQDMILIWKDADFQTSYVQLRLRSEIAVYLDHLMVYKRPPGLLEVNHLTLFNFELRVQGLTKHSKLFLHLPWR